MLKLWFENTYTYSTYLKENLFFKFEFNIMFIFLTKITVITETN